MPKGNSQAILRLRQRELNKQREHALVASERASLDTLIYRKIADLRNAKLSRQILAVKFKRIMIALTKAQKTGNKKITRILENEAAYTESDFKIQDGKVMEQEAELQYLTQNLKQKQPPHTNRNPRTVKQKLHQQIQKLENKMQYLLEEIAEQEEDGFPNKRIVLNKQIELTQSNIETARLRIRLIKFTTNNPREISEHQEVINQDQTYLQQLKRELKQYE
jgi:hypothetical protein